MSEYPREKQPYEARLRPASWVPETYNYAETVSEHELTAFGSAGGSKSTWDRLVETYGDAEFSFFLSPSDKAVDALDVMVPGAGERVASNGTRLRVIGADIVARSVTIPVHHGERDSDA